MKFSERVTNAVKAFTAPTEKATNSSNPAQDFLRYGNKNTVMAQDWSQVQVSDRDMYTGYSYAAINKRANRAVILGKRYLKTDANPALIQSAKEKDQDVEHPYLKLIRESTEFSQRKFWYDISTYLDLEGVYYLMAVRAVAGSGDNIKKVGAIQKLVMLNPYEVKRIIKESTGEVGGYLESHNGRWREIPKEMIIEIKLLNPFDQDEAFSMTDAAKESQYTLKSANDYTRHSIKGNINAPGAISTDVVLEDHIFDNFISRIKYHEKGEPLYGNGSGAINWTSMQIDLDKAALDKINEIHRATLFAVSGTSKTSMGIEESGTGREVSKTQKDDFTEGAIMPQIENIIDALNLDYRKWYTSEWNKNKYEIILDNPLESDHDAELKDIDVQQRRLEMSQQLVQAGYDERLAYQYSMGLIDVTGLGQPTLEEELSDQQAYIMALREAGATDEEIKELTGAMPEEEFNGDTKDNTQTDTQEDLTGVMVGTGEQVNGQS